MSQNVERQNAWQVCSSLWTADTSGYRLNFKVVGATNDTMCETGSRGLGARDFTHLDDLDLVLNIQKIIQCTRFGQHVAFKIALQIIQL
jgi:hypothetical protein